MILAYWEIRGIAHPIRLLLEYTGTPYKELLYNYEKCSDYDKNEWFKDRYTLGLDFPNLPYLIDGNTKITQSNAILRYIGRKHKMCGDTEEEKVRVDILESQAMDFRMQLVRVCHDPNFMTFVDFSMYDILDLNCKFLPACLDLFPNLQEFLTRFEGLKKISAYMNSPRYLPKPVFLKMAKWGTQ
ncbi:glutathione S-transferase Mu 2 isoform X5 [Sarcophilus harrisii]|uniref:glutathione S-transferase Mu 2 isoform X5 n=1 Tax=Sarcophilus harrisii TaxID=9305 RepID=UPI001301CC88|nr:glutathione S-transferase Mu 2 isoform X5 [Sarcophilus harrisii]